MRKIYLIIILITLFSLNIYSQSNYSANSFENSWVYIPNSDMKTISPTTFENSQFNILPTPPPSQPPQTTPPPTGTPQSPPGAPPIQFPFLPPLPPLPGVSSPSGGLPGLPGLPLPPLPPIFGLNPPGTTGGSNIPSQPVPSVPLGIPYEIYSLFHYNQAVPTKAVKKAKDLIK